MTKPALIAVVGPTGTGKSDLAIKIAHALAASGRTAEIVNSDAMQLYRGMDIGTAKLSVAARAGVVHHLIDVYPVTKESTAADYQLLARPLIGQLQESEKVPILVGGSMLYLAAVLNNFEFPGRNPDLRAELEGELLNIGPEALHEKLAALDPTAASRIEPKNGRRIVRALEIIAVTGKPFAAALPETPSSWQPVLQIGLNGERSLLVERLNRRVLNMWQQGLVDEVQQLLKVGLREGKTASQAIGYAQAIAQVDGIVSEEQAIAETQQLTARYARRQMSWFRRDPRITWYDINQENFATDAVKLALSQFTN